MTPSTSQSPADSTSASESATATGTVTASRSAAVSLSPTWTASATFTPSATATLTPLTLVGEVLVRLRMTANVMTADALPVAVVSENGDVAMLEVRPFIRFPVSDPSLPSQSDLLVEITCASNDTTEVQFLSGDVGSGSVVGGVASDSTSRWNTTMVSFVRDKSGAVSPSYAMVPVVGVRDFDRLDGPQPALITCTSATTVLSTSSTRAQGIAVWNRNVHFPWLSDVLVVAGLNNTLVGGSSSSGFALTVSSNQSVCVAAGDEFVLPLVVAMGTASGGMHDCPIDEAASNSTFVCFKTPDVSVLCQKDPVCMSRGGWVMER
jgi:hypothetical protein